MNLNKYKIIFLSILLFSTWMLEAQEYVIPLTSNPILQNQNQKSVFKKVRLSLPFFDDFAYVGPYPDPAKWIDKQAYINNTMSATPMTRGVASLDGLDQFGRPYRPFQYSSGYADSLTSQSIDLSTYDTSNKIYLSFFYQPQGLGFAPETGDSLFLLFKNDVGVWNKIWQTRGTGYTPMQIVNIHIDDAQYLHSDFQFRFMNIASLNLNDDVWNIDYVKLDANRSVADTILNDLAFTVEPTSILGPYSSLPYRHFSINQTNEVTSFQDIEVKNSYYTGQTLEITHKADEIITNTPITTNVLTSTVITPQTLLGLSIPSYPISFIPSSSQSPVVIRNKYYFNSVNSLDSRKNDTIVRDAIFDNYFAYDDGSAEKSYFLYSALNYPAKTALEFHLNQPDTIRGLAVHFGAQAPTALGKFFSIVLYKNLGSTSAGDSIIKQQDLYKVQYVPDINGFSTYAFTDPVVLDAGNYYMGITQPANFGSDSIYYGLDVNNNTSSQHLYYNVDGSWYASTVTGSVMMRPIVGPSFVPTIVNSVTKNDNKIVCFPNPTKDIVLFNTELPLVECKIFDINGRLLESIKLERNSISLSKLAPGNYVVITKDNHSNYYTHKITKQ